jgi:uncharacterized protein (DUF1778 family)
MGRKKKHPAQKQLEMLSARVNFELYKQIEAAAARRDLTLTQVVRVCLRHGVECPHCLGREVA